LGSSISLQLTGEEETMKIYDNVIQAICGIATAFADEKITALAQSMLLQKIDKVNTGVDSQIITGAAALALTGGQVEFRSLLKMYTRLCHIGVLDKKEFVLEAVSASWLVAHPC
jgi:phosphatidylinositol 4-kinase